MLHRCFMPTVSLVVLFASCATTPSNSASSRSQLESGGYPRLASTTTAQSDVKGPSNIDVDSLHEPVVESNSASTSSMVPKAVAEDHSRQGRWEFTAGGAGRNDKNFNEGGFNAGVGLGFFLTDSFEIGVRQDIAYTKSSSTNVDWMTRVALDFNLGDGPLVPFIGANVGYVYGDTVRDTWEAAPEAGLKWYVSDRAFLQLLVEYEFFFKNEDAASTAFKDGQFVYSLGVGVSF